jgi:redox-sensitive bicupin YhaK (pirin superfamily)
LATQFLRGGNQAWRFGVFSGASERVTAPTKNIMPVTMVEVRLDQGAAVGQDLPTDDNAVVVILEGEGAIGAEGENITAGDVAWLTRGDNGKASEVAIRATDKPLRALLYAGRPLHEAVVARGPCHEHRGRD